jgi:hypothetical protein
MADRGRPWGSPAWFSGIAALGLVVAMTADLPFAATVVALALGSLWLASPHTDARIEPAEQAAQERAPLIEERIGRAVAAAFFLSLAPLPLALFAFLQLAAGFCNSPCDRGGPSEFWGFVALIPALLAFAMAARVGLEDGLRRRLGGARFTAGAIALAGAYLAAASAGWVVVRWVSISTPALIVLVAFAAAVAYSYGWAAVLRRVTTPVKNP